MKNLSIIHHTLVTLPGEELVSIPVAPEAGISAFITLKAAGDLTFRKEAGLLNRRHFLTRQGIPMASFYSLKQEHTQEVVSVTGQEDPEDVFRQEADGLITSPGKRVLGITVADCLPLFLYNKEGGHFGLLHSGWKGTGIAAKAVRMMQELWGVSAAALKVVIGPGIGSCCYHVDRERADFFSANFGKDVVEKRNDRFYLDLKMANIHLLQDLGVRDLVCVDNCTACSQEFHSFRRDGAEAFGVMLACIGFFDR